MEGEIMKFVFILTLILFNFTACSDKQLTGTIEQGMIAMSGNKPPKFYKIANVQTMKDYVFDMKDYTISPPLAAMKDFTLLGGWEGAIHYEKDFSIYLDAPLSYHISVSSSRDSEYTQRVKAIEDGDIEYLRKLMPLKKRKNGDVLNFSLSTGHQGRENYSCIVRESIKPKYGKRTISYGCYKVDPAKSKVKKVSITLTYTKAPNLPAQYKHLTKEYTYEDLKNRAKRMLDSLYIKEGW